MVTKLMAIDPFYEEKFTKKNRDQIAYIINRKTDKVEKVSVVPREALEKFVDSIAPKFPPQTYRILLGSVSIIGELHKLYIPEEGPKSTGPDLPKIDGGGDFGPN